jgi:hypothetical protein
MTIKKCAVCKDRDGLLLSLNVPERASYHGRCYHAECLLATIGSIHDERKDDACEQCNAALFSRATWRTRYTLLFSALLRAPHWASLALAMHCAILLQLHAAPLITALFYALLLIGLSLRYRTSPRKLGAAAVGLFYWGYCAHGIFDLSDTFFILRLTILLWLIERGLRVVALLRLVEIAAYDREAGALAWTCTEWPAWLPLYVSLGGGLLAQFACYATRAPLLPLHVMLAVVGAVSLALLLVPPRRVPRARLHLAILDAF